MTKSQKKMWMWAGVGGIVAYMLYKHHEAQITAQALLDAQAKTAAIAGSASTGVSGLDQIYGFR